MKKTKQELSMELEALRTRCTEMATALNESERRLKAAEEMAHIGDWEDTFDTITDIITVHDNDFTIIRANKAAREALSLPDKDRPGVKCFAAYHGLERRPSDCPTCKCMATGEEKQLEVFEPYLNRHLEMAVIPRLDDHGRVKGIIHVSRDVTERKKLEADLQKMKHLESLGLVAAGIAHDFNNLMQGILGNITLAKMRLMPNEPPYGLLVEAEKAYQAAKQLTGQLLTFSKGGNPVRTIFDINGLIRELVPLLLAGSGTAGDLRLHGSSLPVNADESQIRRVMHNLMVNAREAMSFGGTVTVTTEPVSVAGGESPPLEEGRYVLVTVTDTGTGIPQGDLERIFDPYFSTKTVGNQKGMGLGLTICHSILRKHRGHIKVRSEPGRGSTFYAYLPLAETPATPPRPTEKRTPDRLRGKVLVMDDEPAVLDVTAQFLQAKGFETVEALEGNEAVGKYAEELRRGDPFDVVLLDLTVPGGMGGIETVRRLMGIDPKVRAIVSSGYPDDPAVRDFGKYGFKASLVKPYGMAALEEVVSRVISAV